MSFIFEIVPALVVAAAIVAIPGGAVAVVLRLRGFVALAMAPAISISIISISAIVGPWFGWPWRWWVPALGTVVVVTALLILRHVVPILRNSLASAVIPDKRGLLIWALAGASVGATAITIRIAIAAGDPEQITQNYDTVFHLNAIRYIQEEDNASSWFISGFVRPTADAAAFYPAAWHGLVSLLVLLSGASIPAATNVMSLLTFAIIWPLGTLFLTRVLAGPRLPVLAAAGVLSAAFAAFPYLLLYYGTIYPNALSNALVSVGLALMLILLRQGRQCTIPLPTAILLFILYLPAQVLSQPNGVFSIALLLTPLVAVLLFRNIRQSFARSVENGVVRLAVIVSSILAVGLLLLSSPTFRSLLLWSYEKVIPFSEALWRALMNFPLPTAFPALILSALLLIGLYWLARYEQRAWLIASFGLVILAYAVSAGTNNDLAKLLVGPWYGKPARLVALAPLFGVPLAAVGVNWLAGKMLPPRLFRDRALLRHRRVFIPVAAVLASSSVVVFSPTLAQMNAKLAHVYAVPATPKEVKQLDKDELALLRKLDQYTPETAVLANNPWNGSSLAMALSDRSVLYPYMTMYALGDDRELLSRRLNEIGTAESVCAAAQRLGVAYLLDFGDEPIAHSRQKNAMRYPGIDKASESEAFKLVAEAGHAKLYKLKDCAGAFQ